MNWLPRRIRAMLAHRWIYSAVASIIIIGASSILWGQLTTFQEQLFNFTTYNPVPVKPFDVLSNGEHIDMLSGGLILSKEDIVIPGRFDQPLTVGHTLITEPQSILSFPVNPDFKQVLEDQQTISIGQSQPDIERVYGASFDVSSYEAINDDVAHSFVVDDVAPLGRITFGVKGGKNEVRWIPQSPIHWGEYAGIILVTRIYPHYKKEAASSSVTGERIAYLVKNDGTLEMFDSLGNAISGQQIGVVRYFHGDQLVDTKPTASCEQYVMNGDYWAVDENCDFRRKVRWSGDDINGIEYVDLTGNVYTFKGNSAKLITTTEKTRDICKDEANMCQNGTVPGGINTGGSGSLDWEEKDVYMHGVPFLRIEGFRLLSVKDSFKNKREYQYDGSGNITISENVGEPQSSNTRRLLITKGDDGTRRVCGPLLNDDKSEGRCDSYELDDSNRLVRYTDRNGESSSFIYNPSEESTPSRFVWGLSSGNVGERSAFVELHYPTGAVSRYEQYGKILSDADGVAAGTRAVLVTAWSGPAGSDSFLQKQIVVNPPWEDLGNNYRLTVAYDVDGSETSYVFGKQAGYPVLRRKAVRVNDGYPISENFAYSQGKAGTDGEEKDVIRGISSHQLHYAGAEFTTTYSYSGDHLDDLRPHGMRRPDGSQAAFSYLDSVDYSFKSELAEEEKSAVTINIKYPPTVTSQSETFKDADNNDQVKQQTFSWGGADECGLSQPLPNNALSSHVVTSGGSSITTSFCYDSVGNIIKAKKKYSADDGNGIDVDLTYGDTRLYPASKKIGNATWKYEYDLSGRITKETNANGAAKYFVYYASGRIRRILYGTNGSFKEFAYNVDSASGTTIITATNYDQIRAKSTDDERTYDGFGRITKEDKDGSKTRYAYNDRGYLASLTTYLETQVSETQTTEIDTNVKRYYYDAIGRISHITSSDTGTVGYQYDTTPAGWVGGQPPIAIRRAAYVGGKNVRNRYFSVDGRLLRDEYEMDGANPIAINYGYDALGNRIRKVTPQGLETKWVYDGLSRMTRATLASGLNLTVNDWSATGDPLKVIYEGTGQENTFTYNTARRAVADATFGGSGIPYYVKFNYDENDPGQNGIGRLTSIQDSIGSSRYIYDPSGSLSMFERKINELNTTYQVGTIKDVNGRVYRLTYSDGRSVYYLADTDGRISNVRINSLQGPIIASFTYDAKNRLGRIDYGNGVAAVYRYVGELLMEVLIEIGKQELYHVEYSYDDRGRRTEAVYHDASRIKYSYDDADRIVKAEYLRGSEAKAHDTQTYEYDKDGNRTKYSDSFKSITYAYDSYERLTQANYADGDGWKFTYDSFGRLAERKHERSGQVLAWQRFAWNNAGQLVGVDTLDAEGNITAKHEYAYDSSGRREKRLRAGKADYAIYGELIDSISELNSAGEVERDFIYMEGRRIASIDGERIDFFHVDDIGSTLLTTDENGKVTSGYRYDPFGNVNFSIGDGENMYRFAGKHYDDETGLIYFGGRYYDPVVGRFISPDPVNEGTNPYSYAVNNPFGAKDVFGLMMDSPGMWSGGGMDGEVSVSSGLSIESEEDSYPTQLHFGLSPPIGLPMMDGPAYGMSPMGFIPLVAVFSLLNLAGLDIDFNPGTAVDFLFAPLGMATEEKECNDENCDKGAADETLGLKDPVNDAFSSGEGGRGETSVDPSPAGEQNPSSESNDSDGGGNGPDLNAPQANNPGTADESYGDKYPAGGSDYGNSGIVEDIVNDKIGGDGAKPARGETSNEMTLPVDNGNNEVQKKAGSPSPNENTTGGTDPITLHNAEVLNVERALKIPGRGMDFEFVRTYRSRIEYDGPMGYNWDHNYNKRIVKVDRPYCAAHPLDVCCDNATWEGKPDDYIACYMRFDGNARFDAYRNDDAGHFKAPFGYFDRLSKHDDGTVTIRDRNGVTNFYASDGTCSAIEDRFGNRIELVYEANGNNKRLVRVIDTLGRSIDLRYNGKRVSEVEDFSGRKLRFSYDGSGNLVSITKPATAAFPNGSTTTYAYTSGYPTDKEMLNHNLISVTDPLGQTYTEFAYSFTDRVVWHRFGDGIFTIQSTMMGSWPACETQQEVNSVASRTRITDRNGNERLHEFNCQGNALAVHEYTRGLRQGDPAEYVTLYSYDLNGLTTSAIRPAGNRLDISYQNAATGDPSIDRLFAANPVLIRRTPDAARGGDALETTISYEPLAMQPLTETRAGITRTYRYDYQEGANLAQLAAAMGVSQPIASQIFAGVALNQGDLNEDGITNSAQGNRVMLDEPPVHDIDANLHAVRRLFRYNDHGQPSSEIDPLGVETRYSYYAVGNQRGLLEKKTVDPAGLMLTTSYDYDARGNPATVQDASGAISHYSYDERNQLLETVDAQGAITRNSYDAEGNLVRTDKPGSVDEGDLWITTKFTYNSLNRPVIREDEVQADKYAITELRYDPGERLTRTIKPLGNSIVTNYDERDLVMSVRKGADSGVESIERRRYDDNGNLIETVDAVGNKTSYAYDGHDRLIDVIDPSGNRAHTQYDAFDRPVAISKYGAPVPGGDPATLLAHQGFMYDELGEKISTRDYAVSGGVVGAYHEKKYYYDAAGRKTSEVDAEGSAALSEYDAAGRLTNSRDAAGNETRYSYDGMGRPIVVTKQEIDESDGTTKQYTEQFTYNGLGQLVAHQDAMGHVERKAYDGRGNLIWKADAKGAAGLDSGGDAGTGNVTRYRFDGLNRLIKLAEEMRAGGAGNGALLGAVETIYSWDANGNLASIKDANSNTTKYEYDAQDRRTLTIMPDARSYSVEFDAMSRPSREIDPRGVAVRYVYDPSSHMTLRAASSSGVLMRRDDIGYDGLGRMREATSRDGAGALISKIEEGFDSFGRNDMSKQGGASVLRIFDATGRVLSVAGQNGITAVYQRDAIGRISSVAEASLGVMAQPLFVGPARHSKVALGNGLVVNETYDAAAREVSRRVEDSLHNMLAGFDVGYDRAGQKLYEKRLHESGSGELYQYDSLNRLIASSRGVANPEQHIGETVPASFANHVTYAIDPVHNWTARVEYRDPSNTALNVARTYVPNTLNQYAATSQSIDGGASLNTSFIYDEAGNLIDDGKYRYTYDDRNLVTEVRDSLNNTFIAAYAYDAMKRRISELRDNGTVTTFIYDGWQEVQEITDGTLTASFIYDDGIDHPIAMVRDNHVYYYHADTRNNIAAITNESGGIVERYSYDPYGTASITNAMGQAITESTIGNMYRFSSRRYDEATGLYYYRHRMYSPQLGRFMQRDPEWFVDSMNLFAYVNDNPVLWIDPFGLNKNSADLKDYSNRGFGDALQKAGIVTDAASVTVTSLRAFEIGGKTLLYVSRGMTTIGTASTAYSLYEGVAQRDTLKTVSAGMDLAVGIATLAVESESPGAAAAITVVYVGSKWGILTAPDGFVSESPVQHSNGGGGSYRDWQ